MNATPTVLSGDCMPEQYEGLPPEIRFRFLSLAESVERLERTVKQQGIENDELNRQVSAAVSGIRGDMAQTANAIKTELAVLTSRFNLIEKTVIGAAGALLVLILTAMATGVLAK